MRTPIFQVLSITRPICGSSNVAVPSFLRARGIEHRGIFAEGGVGGFHFVVRAMSIEFLRPALMDDMISVVTNISAVRGASIEMDQQIRRGDDILLTAKVKIAVVAEGRRGGSPQKFWQNSMPLEGN